MNTRLMSRNSGIPAASILPPIPNPIGSLVGISTDIATLPSSSMSTSTSSAISNSAGLSFSSSNQLVPKTCKAYDINALDDVAEEKENEGMPDSHFFPKEGDTILAKEKGIRELNRRYGKRKAALEYEAELAAEAKQLRRMLGCDEEAGVSALGVQKKVQYHFTDQDGKQYVSLVKDVNKSCFKKSMAFLRMMDPIRVIELCTDDLHIVMDVDHSREWFFSKSNLSVSLLPPHWSSMDLWNTILHFPVMTPEKFSSLLLFNASYENLKKFSLADFLKSTSSLDSIDLLKITLDNLQTVYHCIFGSVYKDLCSIPKSFLQANVRILEIREFSFILDVFNKAYVNFQMDMRTRNIDVPNTAPLNTYALVIQCFNQWFTFSVDMFTQEAEAVFRMRPRYSMDGKGSTMSSAAVNAGGTTKKTSNPKANTTTKPNMGPKPPTSFKNPCVRHLASILGISGLAGESPVVCKLGANCRYAHYALPLGKPTRKMVMEFVSTSSIGLLKVKADRDLLLQKL